MRIHHLNCGTLCPIGGRVVDGVTRGLGKARLVCHCLLIESERGLILVDTGLGMKDVLFAEERLSPFFLRMLLPRLDSEETAVVQVKRLGFSPDDVRHLVLTHLDFDHAGGIEDFPNADLHLHADEKVAALHRMRFLDRARYRPVQFTRYDSWKTYSPGGEKWFGFDAVRDLQGVSPDVLLIPLIGHSAGHCGVAVRTERGWILHAGDAYFYRGEMDVSRPRCTLGLRGFQKMLEVDRGKRIENQERLRALIAHQGSQVTVFSSHDPVEFLALAHEERFLPAQAEIEHRIRRAG